MELVKMRSGKAVVSSLDIADKFGKAHSVVLRKIDMLDCSKEFLLNSFAQCDFTNAKGRKFRRFDVTRDGFSFLAMSFTGKESARWKEKYIAAFNHMENKIVSLATGLNNIESVADEVKRITSDSSLSDGQKLDLVCRQNDKARDYASQAGKALSGYRKMKSVIQEDEQDLKEKVQLVFEI